MYPNNLYSILRGESKMVIYKCTDFLLPILQKIKTRTNPDDKIIHILRLNFFNLIEHNIGRKIREYVVETFYKYNL